MIVSAVRSRQVSPVTSAQMVAVASRRFVASPRKVNLQACNEPLARSVKSSASDICAREISEAVPGHVPGSFVPVIFAGNTGAEFSSKRIQGHLQAEPALADVGEVDADRIEVEAAREGERADGEPALLPRSRAAELRKAFAKPGRFDRDVARTENAGFDLGAGKHAVVQIDDGVAIFDMKLDSREFEIVRQEVIEDSPGETLRRRRRLRISADVHGDCFSP